MVRNLNYINLKLIKSEKKSSLILISIFLTIFPVIFYTFFKNITFPFVVIATSISYLINSMLSEKHNETILLSLPIKRSTVKLNTLIIDLLSILISTLYTYLIVFVISGLKTDYKFLNISLILGIAICLMLFTLRNVSSRFLSNKRNLIFNSFLRSLGYVSAMFLNSSIEFDLISHTIILIPGILFLIYLLTYIDRLNI